MSDLHSCLPNLLNLFPNCMPFWNSSLSRIVVSNLKLTRKHQVVSFRYLLIFVILKLAFQRLLDFAIMKLVIQRLLIFAIQRLLNCAIQRLLNVAIQRLLNFVIQKCHSEIVEFWLLHMGQHGPTWSDMVRHDPTWSDMV